jgi:hypothetical protein
MFQQLLTPVGDSLGLSFIVAILPIIAVLVLLGVLRRPAWQAALAGLITGLIIAVTGWKMPVGLATASVLNGAVFALWPVMWIVINTLLLYNIAVRSGRFDAFRNWVVGHLPNDRRVILVVIGFCFGALLEGVSGFGTPVAITSSLLILVGYPPLEAVVFVLIFNTAPVAFGALGAPVTVLGAVIGLPTTALAAMIGRQLPIIATILPFYVIALYGGWRSVRVLWPVLLVAGGSFAMSQFAASNFIDYTLTDVLSSLGSLIASCFSCKFGGLHRIRCLRSRIRRLSRAVAPPRLYPIGRVGCRGLSYPPPRSFGARSSCSRSGNKILPGPACIVRFRSRSIIANRTTRSGCSSPWERARLFFWRPSSLRFSSVCHQEPFLAASARPFASAGSPSSR